MIKRKTASKFVICVKNSGYEAALEPRKIYRVLVDRQADQNGLLRVRDESGESYLYPEQMFVSIALPRLVTKVLRLAA